MTQSYSGRSAGAFRKRGVVARLSDLIWPPRSLLSDVIVDRPGVIEPALWAELNFLAGPACFRCGFPLQEEVSAEAVCGACAGRSPPYDRMRAALAYDDHARRLILDLKRGGRRDGLPVFARWMSAAGQELIDRVDFIAPAPMHWTRLAIRSFSQAAWLAQALARETGKPWRPEALKRVKRCKSQAGLTASERRRNVAGAIKATGRFDGKKVLLVDDVFTPGATLERVRVHFAKPGLQKCMA